jgi:peptidoglycan hydrolase-like protein with peptidoglycan-binding domain
MAENGRLPDSDLAPTLLGGRLRKDAADSADRLFTKYALDTGGVLQAVSPADTYRSYEQQVQARKNVGNLAAVPGTSNHGWGVAVDFANGMNSWSSAAQDWFRRNGGDFGWETPDWASNPRNRYYKNEPWHKEFDPAKDKRKGPKIRHPKKGEIGIGSKGKDVERIQVLLNQRLPGKNLVVDGHFGLASAVATARYQHQAKGLSVTGTVGPKTLASLEGPKAPKPTKPSKPVEKDGPPIYLKRGTGNKAGTRALQEFLRRVFPGRFGKGAEHEVVVDGDYGPRTEYAVKHWQKKAGLAPTGEIGPKSHARLVKFGVFDPIKED